jgi:hypothetical protein
VDASSTKKNCRACRYSYMESNSGLICGHPDAGLFGLNIRTEPCFHCMNFAKFEQHPSRLPNGDLKSAGHLPIARND